MSRRFRRSMLRRSRVGLTDKRSPMLRLLVDGQMPGGMVAVNYHEQWRTLSKAMRLGYVDANQIITEKGRAFIAKEQQTATPS